MTHTTLPVHPDAEHPECLACRGLTYGVALECAYENRHDAGTPHWNEPTAAAVEAAGYVTDAIVPAYNCARPHRH